MKAKADFFACINHVSCLLLIIDNEYQQNWGKKGNQDSKLHTKVQMLKWPRLQFVSLLGHEMSKNIVVNS